MNSSPKYIDLFAGGGGLSEGFTRAGFEPVAHVEMDKAACLTLKTRSAYHYLKQTGKSHLYTEYLMGLITRNDLYSLIPGKILDSVINLSISDETNELIQNQIDEKLDSKQVDLIIGGPPCQAYSIAGRSRSKTKMVNDPRNYLFEQYAKYLDHYQPKIFVFENVLGLESANNGQYLKSMRELFNEKGYKTELYRLEAKDFGVLQNRRRIIIIGTHKDFAFLIPDLSQIKINPNASVSDLFDDLPKLKAGDGQDKFSNYIAETNDYLNETGIRNGIDILTHHVARPHTDQDREIYRIAVSKWNENSERLNYNDLPERLKTHNNRISFVDRFKVVAGDGNCSQTVVSHIAKDGHYYIHPDINQNRSITIREAARLQSFPDDYYFEGIREGVNRTPAFKQIGNAVPPLMAYEIAKIIRESL